MLATALTPYIGYENTVKVVHLAHENGLSLKEATLSLGYLSEEEFDRYFKPESMV
jgi:fumarate hydratase class II